MDWIKEVPNLNTLGLVDDPSKYELEYKMALDWWKLIPKRKYINKWAPAQELLGRAWFRGSFAQTKNKKKKIWLPFFSQVRRVNPIPEGIFIAAAINSEFKYKKMSKFRKYGYQFEGGICFNLDIKNSHIFKYEEKKNQDFSRFMFYGEENYNEMCILHGILKFGNKNPMNVWRGWDLTISKKEIEEAYLREGINSEIICTYNDYVHSKKRIKYNRRVTEFKTENYKIHFNIDKRELILDRQTNPFFRSEKVVKIDSFDKEYINILRLIVKQNKEEILEIEEKRLLEEEKILEEL